MNKSYIEARRRATRKFNDEVRSMDEYDKIASETEEENLVANLMVAAREKARLTQAQVAKEMGIGQSACSRMERGNATIKNFIRCLRICGYTLKIVPDKRGRVAACR